MKKTRIQFYRTITQTGFFLLFVLAPPLNIFRYDLTQGLFIVLGHNWTLGLDVTSGSNSTAALHVLFFGLLPVVCIAIIFLFIAWRWGRIYCGWLCPHFSVVEWINKLMLRACGKPSIWEKKTLPSLQPDQRIVHPDRRYWPVTIIMVLLFSMLWAVTLLTYLLPPFSIYSNLYHGELTRNQTLFISIATLLFCIEFFFARHFFCRFGCAVGVFQSVAWMANRRAMVVAFDTDRARACQSCNNACDNVCPMRLQPRTIKRKMFSCTQCGECLSACTQVQQFTHQPRLLHWVNNEEAMPISASPISPPVSSPVKHRTVKGQ